MIIDKIENIESYKDLQPYAEAVRGFIARVEKENLEAGKYELDGENLFAYVQRYETKDFAGTRMESHVAYADLQYVISGEEAMYADAVSDLKLEEDQRPEADMIFYKEQSTYRTKDILSAGTFGYYLPQDGHMPGITVDEKQNMVKIVFKIKMQ